MNIPIRRQQMICILKTGLKNVANRPGADPQIRIDLLGCVGTGTATSRAGRMLRNGTRCRGGSRRVVVVPDGLQHSSTTKTTRRRIFSPECNLISQQKRIMLLHGCRILSRKIELRKRLKRQAQLSQLGWENEYFFSMKLIPLTWIKITPIFQINKRMMGKEKKLRISRTWNPMERIIKHWS